MATASFSPGSAVSWAWAASTAVFASAAAPRTLRFLIQVSMALRARAADRGRGLVARQEHYGTLVDQAERAFQRGEDLQDLRAEPVDLSGRQVRSFPVRDRSIVVLIAARATYWACPC